MNFAEYEAAALDTAVYPGQGKALGLQYVALKMNGEAGELAEHVGKAIRDDGFGAVTVRGDGQVETPLTLARQGLIKKEIGDVLWYLAAAAREMDTSLHDIAIENIAKLHDRKRRGVLGGSGDIR